MPFFKVRFSNAPSYVDLHVYAENSERAEKIADSWAEENLSERGEKEYELQFQDEKAIVENPLSRSEFEYEREFVREIDPPKISREILRNEKIKEYETGTNEWSYSWKHEPENLEQKLATRWKVSR